MKFDRVRQVLSHKFQQNRKAVTFHLEVSDVWIWKDFLGERTTEVNAEHGKILNYVEREREGYILNDMRSAVSLMAVGTQVVVLIGYEFVRKEKSAAVSSA